MPNCFLAGSVSCLASATNWSQVQLGLGSGRWAWASCSCSAAERTFSRLAAASARSGAGAFALGYAARHPGRRYVAIEWRKKYARELEHRAQARALSNLRVVEADARAVIPRLFAPGSLAVKRADRSRDGAPLDRLPCGDLAGGGQRPGGMMTNQPMKACLR